MKPENWIGVAQIVITLVGMVVGPYIAIRLSLKQFRSQKWWEKQEELYRTLLENLSFLYSQYLEYLNDLIKGQDRTLSEETRKLTQDARRQIERCTEFGSYLISEELAKALRKVLWVEGDHAYEHYDLMTDALRAAIDILRSEANIHVKPAKG